MNKYKQYIQHWFIQFLVIFFCICYFFVLSITRSSMHSANAANITPSPQFTDIKPQTYDAIVTNYLYQKGIITGYADGSFGLQKTINRIEATAMLVRSIKKEPMSTTYEKFIDTDASAWYAKSLQTAKEQGVIQGYADGSFKPENNVSRAELMKMLSKSWGLPANTEHTFTDVETNSYYEPFVGWYEKQGIFFAPLLLPSRPITRQEVARALYAAMMLQPKNTIAPTTNPVENNSIIHNAAYTQAETLHQSASNEYLTNSNRTIPTAEYTQGNSMPDLYSNAPELYSNTPNDNSNAPALYSNSTDTYSNSPSTETLDLYTYTESENYDEIIDTNTGGPNQENYSGPDAEDNGPTTENENTQTDFDIHSIEEFVPSDETENRPTDSDETIFSLLYFDDSKFFP